MGQTKRGSKVVAGIAGSVILVAVAIGVAVWLISQQSSPTAEPTPSATSTPPSAAEVEELDNRLASGERESVAAALGLPLDDATDDIVTGFAELKVEWDTAVVTEVAPGAWTIPASVTQPDGTTSEWSVTLVRSDLGLVFVDSEVLS
ncbi:hypothetical protein [Microbacterium sp. W4I20]|uniref:hypothetical protein n=1 Tax=Microbacterium sp. W4I20 TaxID=3042262 RepID=UPI0027852850|nr:hypothetical protein [Microbacterium sp. W4I20]MDQ0728842.1 cytoskeletal protein RodZ [Microbacterium sp. W4I20]